MDLLFSLFFDPLLFTIEDPRRHVTGDDDDNDVRRRKGTKRLMEKEV